MLLTTLRTLWTLPTTALGLALGIACFPTGTRVQLVDGVLEFHSGGIAWLLRHAIPLDGGALAMTLGDVVLAVSPAALDMTRAHERVHVRQARLWGPFFIPAYLAASLIAWLQLRGAYRGNMFERQAYAISDGED